MVRKVTYLVNNNDRVLAGRAVEVLLGFLLAVAVSAAVHLLLK